MNSGYGFLLFLLSACMAWLLAFSLYTLWRGGHWADGLRDFTGCPYGLCGLSLVGVR